MYRIKTPSPYEESEFTIPEVYSSDRLIDWINDLTVDEWLIVERKAIDFIIKKHSKKGGVFSKYGLYYKFSDKNSKESLRPMDSSQIFQTYELTSEHWFQLIKNPKTKIIFIPLTIDNGGVYVHANMIIIDKRRKCVEFFDPHGNEIMHNGEHLIDLFRHLYICGPYLEKHCFIPETYRIKNYIISCPSKGFQHWENSYETDVDDHNMGYCVFWTIFLLDLRLSNLSFDMNYIQSKYIRTSLKENDNDYKKLSEKFRKFIIEYSNYWGENFARRNPKRTCRR